MIRFSGALVAVAVGVLVGGVVTSKLLVVYIAIGLSVAALVALAIGVLLKRAELFGAQGLPSQNQVLPNVRVDSPEPAIPAAGSAAFAVGQFPRNTDARRTWVTAQEFAQPGYTQPAQPAFGQGPAHGRQAPVWDAPARQAPGRQPQPFAPPRTDAAPSDAPPQPFAPPRTDAAPPAAPAAPLSASAAPPSQAPLWADRPSRSYDDTFGSSKRSSTPTPPAEPPAQPGRDRSATPSWFDRPTVPRHDSEDEQPAARSAAAERESDATRDAGATQATDRTTEAGTSPGAGAPKSGEPVKATDQKDEPASSARGTTAAKDDDSVDPAEAAHTKPAATATREADSGSAPAEPAETGKSAASAEKTENAASDDEQDDEQRAVVVVPGVPRYHTDNCILIRFMDDDDMQQMSLKSATEAGCTPCRACQPED